MQFDNRKRMCLNLSLQAVGVDTSVLLIMIKQNKFEEADICSKCETLAVVFSRVGIFASSTSPSEGPAEKCLIFVHILGKSNVFFTCKKKNLLKRLRERKHHLKLPQMKGISQCLLQCVESSTLIVTAEQGGTAHTGCSFDSPGQITWAPTLYILSPPPTPICRGTDKKWREMEEEEEKAGGPLSFPLNCVSLSRSAPPWPEGFHQKGKQEWKFAMRGKWGSLWGEM